MKHKLFGKLNYKDDFWLGEVVLPGFPAGAPKPLPVHVADPDKEGPSPRQDTAFQHIVAKTNEVFESVAGALFGSFQNAYADEHWRSTCGLKLAKSFADLAGKYQLRTLQIMQEYHNDISFSVFSFEAEWGGDGEMLVVYHPNKPAVWTIPSGLYDVIESDEPVGEEDFVPSPSQELVNAILIGDNAKAKKLIAAGMDINALAPSEYPPLWIAVQQLDASLVRRMLEYGADPALKNPDEKTTPLQHAKSMYKEMGFAPSKKKGSMTGILKDLARGAFGSAFAQVQANLEEIIKLLEEAPTAK